MILNELMIDHFRAFLHVRQDFCLILLKTICRYLESDPLENFLSIQIPLAFEVIEIILLV